MTLKYDDLITRISQRFDSALKEIDAEFNFDLGPEFEIAICKLLQRVLPTKYGICRGFAVNELGETAGDDIFIFERIRFPTVRSLNSEDYSQKEKVPIDAVLAYIEAKNTLQLGGKGEGTLTKAASQAAKVKSLVNQRKRIAPHTISNRTSLPKEWNFEVPEGYPDFRNPMYTMIFGRRVRIEGERNVATNADVIHAALQRPVEAVPTPDIIVAGPNNAVVPSIFRDDRHEIKSPFFLESEGSLISLRINGYGFGIAVAHLLWALDSIELGTMPWGKIVAEGLGCEFGPGVV